MKKSLYILFAFCMMFTSCKKTELPPENETETIQPVFYAKCNVNGFPLSVEAGTNGYYMNSSYYQDEHNVYVYKAELKQKNCDSTQSCGYGLTMLINDIKVSSVGAAMNADAALKVSNYIFDNVHPAPMYYIAKFKPVDAFTANANYKWEFSDGLKESGYEITHTMTANEIYSVKYIFSSPCDANHTNVFKVGDPFQTVVQATRDMSLASELNYKFSATPTGTGPFKYIWNFGDGSATAISNDPLPNHTYTTPNKYTTLLKLVDAKGDTCTSKYQVAAYFERNCSANFTAEFTPVNIEVLLSAITVQVTDANGIVYSSKDLKQPANSKFEIVSVEDYKTNALGEPTKKIKVKFNCTLDNNGSQVVINNGEAVIAVAFKK